MSLWWLFIYFHLMQPILIRATKQLLGRAWLVRTGNQTPCSCMHWAWLWGAWLAGASQARLLQATKQAQVEMHMIRHSTCSWDAWALHAILICQEEDDEFIWSFVVLFFLQAKGTDYSTRSVVEPSWVELFMHVGDVCGMACKRQGLSQ